MAYIDKFIDALYRLSADQLEVSSGRRVILGVGDTRKPVTARPATAEQVNWLLREIRSGTLDVLDEESEQEQFVYSAPAGIVRISVERVDGLPLIRIMPYGVDEALLTESEGTAESADAEANGGPADSTADESPTDSQAEAAATSSEAVEPSETSELDGAQMAAKVEEEESDSEEPTAVASFEDEEEASEAEEQMVVATSEAEEEMPEAEQSVVVATSEVEEETSDSEEQEAVATWEEEEVNGRQDELAYAETDGTDISAEAESALDDAEDESSSADSEEVVTHEVEVVPLASAESSAATPEPVDSPEAEYAEDPEYAGLVTAARAAFSGASAEPEPPIRPVRILVTEPSDDAADQSLVAEAEGATTEAGDAAVVEIDTGADVDAQGYSEDGDGYGYTHESESVGSDVSEYTATTSFASEGPTAAEAPAGEDISEAAEAEVSPYLAAASSYSPEADAGASWYDRVYQESATEVDDRADAAAENDGGADLDSAAESVQWAGEAETEDTPVQTEDEGTTFQAIETNQTDDTAQPDEAGDPSLAMHEEPAVPGDEGDGYALSGVVEPEEFEDEVGEVTSEAEVEDAGESELVAAVAETEATAVAEEVEAEDLESYAEAVADAHEDSGLPEAMSGDFEAAAVADLAGEYTEEASDDEAYAEEAHPAEAYAEEAYAEAADPEEGAAESDLAVTEEEDELAPEEIMDEAEISSSEILEAEAPSETEDADQGVEGEAAASMAASLTPGERLEALFRRMVDEGWTDLHVSPGVAPLFRRNGELLELEDEALTTQEAREMLLAFLSTEKLRELDLSSHVDFVLEVPEVGRFRCNLFEDHRGWGGLMRVISSEVPTVEGLGLPVEIVELCELSEGLVLITGARGSGKSRTLAGMIDYINRTRANRVVTFEDPIEFVHANQNSLISQREVGAHNESLADALRAALRENPDVIVLGEMRDLETVETAVEAAEMGHLVFATLPTRTAASTVDRILEQFPAGRQSRVRTMLAASLKAVISQTLVAAKGGGKVAALEFLPVTRTVSNLIREGNTYQIPGVLERGIDEGMRPLNHVLLELVKYGKVEPAAAYAAAVDKKELESLFSREGIDWMRDPWRHNLEEAEASDEPSHA